MKVLIVGGGIGGLTAALAIRQAGHQVHVIEQADAFGEVGAGIQISPNGARLLYRLGLEPVIRSVGTMPEYGIMRDSRGHRIARFPLSRSSTTNYEVPYYHIHRADLIELLSNALINCEERVVSFSSRLQSISEHDGVTTVHTENGQTFSADLVIGADGIHSRVRDFVVGPGEPDFSGLVAWRGLIPFEVMPNGHKYDRPQIWIGKGRHVVTYPLRHEQVYNFVAVANTQEAQIESWANQDDNSELKKTFSGWHPNIRELIEHLPNPFVWGLYERPPTPRWHKNRVALLGDAVHPMLPAMAQGAVMAIEDAYTLGRLLTGKSVEDLPSVLAEYQSARLPRARAVYEQASENLDFFHRRNPMFRMLGTAALRTIGDRSEVLLAKKYDWIYGYDADQPLTSAPTVAA